MSTPFVNGSNLHVSGGTFNQYNTATDREIEKGFQILREAATPAAIHTAGGSVDRPKCHENTRVAILAHLMDWMVRNLEEDKIMMWLYGDAGAGKSAISQTLAERCAAEKTLLGDFFFSRNDSSRSTEKSLVATIAYQAALAVPGLKERIASAVTHNPAIFETNLKTEISTLLIDPINDLSRHSDFDPETVPHVITIDGLDECSDHAAQCRILDVLSSELRRSDVPLKLLVASRPEVHLRAKFNSEPLPSLSTSLALNHDPLQSNADIQHFLESTFNTIKTTHPFHDSIPDTWPPPGAVDKLVKTSSGQFIYASTVARYITSPRHRPTEQLEKVLKLRPLASEKDLPFAELDALYHFLFSLIDADKLSIVLLILGLVIFDSEEGVSHIFRGHRRQDPPGLELVRKFLWLEPGQIEHYLADLASVLKWEPNLVHISHASLSDFLLDSHRSKEFISTRRSISTRYFFYVFVIYSALQKGWRSRL